MSKSDKKENITQLWGNTACIKHLMRTRKDKFRDEYGKKLNKALTEVVVVVVVVRGKK
jgi:hypothetical protein